MQFCLKKKSGIYNSACERRTSTDCTLKFPEKCILTRKSLHKWRARTIIKVGALICCVLNALAGTHTHGARLLFTLSKVSLSFHSRSSRWVGFWSAPV